MLGKPLRVPPPKAFFPVTSDRLDQRRPARIDRVPLGILYMLGATVMFAACSAISKWQVASYSFVEVLIFRSGVSLVTCAALILPRTGPSASSVG